MLRKEALKEHARAMADLKAEVDTQLPCANRVRQFESLGAWKARKERK